MEEQCSLNDLALKAGVSPATVSLALNNRKGVNQKTRERILSIAEEIGYQKRAGAISYSSVIQFIQIIRHGHVLNRDHNVFIADYIEGITGKAKELRMKVEISSFQPDTTIQDILRFMGSQTADGFIILGTELSQTDFEQFSKFEKPIVFLDAFFEAYKMDFVDMDNSDSISEIIDLLIETGHRSIGMVSAPVSTRNFTLRENSFKESIEQKGLPYSSNSMLNVDSTFQGAYRDFLSYLNGKPKLPQAFFCVNDIVCLGVMKALKEKGYAIPEDVSLIGFDDLPTSTQSEPPLTTVRVFKKDIGSMALTLLKERIVRSDAPQIKVLISGELIIRESVKDRRTPSSV